MRALLWSYTADTWSTIKKNRIEGDTYHIPVKMQSIFIDIYIRASSFDGIESGRGHFSLFNCALCKFWINSRYIYSYIRPTIELEIETRCIWIKSKPIPRANFQFKQNKRVRHCKECEKMHFNLEGIIISKEWKKLKNAKKIMGWNILTLLSFHLNQVDTDWTYIYILKKRNGQTEDISNPRSSKSA